MAHMSSRNASSSGRIRLAHASQRGRARLEIAGLYRTPRVKRQLEQGLGEISGIRDVNASTLTGRVLIVFSPTIELLDIARLVGGGASDVDLYLSSEDIPGVDFRILVDELRSVFDPRGGYFKKGGKYKPSLVAEIGDAIECHMKMTGMIEDKGIDDFQKEILDAKRKEYESIHANGSTSSQASDSEFPANSQLCMKCHTKAVISMDGCMTCLNCGDSKCG